MSWTLTIPGVARAVTLEDLERHREALRGQLRAAPADGRVHLELGLLEKLLGGSAGYGAAFHHLGRALELLPQQATPERQRALFVLALTHGDVGDPHAALDRFAQVVHVDRTTRAARAAWDYARAYREHYGI